MAYEIDRELIDRIIKAADIVAVISSYIPVIKKGRNYEAICPFHDDTNPSLKISVDKMLCLWYKWKCSWIYSKI